MDRAIPLTVVLLLSFLGGCAGDKVEEDETRSPSPSPGDNETIPRVTILNFTEAAETEDPINVTWEVVPGVNTTFNITSTAVFWSNESVENPRTPADYNHTAGEHLSTVPGEFNASFEVETEGDLFLRAHALIEGQHHWSDEVVINVTKGLPEGKDWTVEIGGGGVGPLADYDPDPLTVTVGDRVKWANMDATGTSHTATSDSGAPASFDTGSVARGDESDYVLFVEPGTYRYHCNIHPTTMSGAEIVVEAASD